MDFISSIIANTTDRLTTTFAIGNIRKHTHIYTHTHKQTRTNSLNETR